MLEHYPDEGQFTHDSRYLVSSGDSDLQVFAINEDGSIDSDVGPDWYLVVGLCGTRGVLCLNTDGNDVRFNFSCGSLRSGFRRFVIDAPSNVRDAEMERFLKPTY